jgi:hypothetical protein
MNVKRINAVADAIERGGMNLAMDEWVNDCGTAACIGGWTVALFNNEGRLRPSTLMGDRLSRKIDRSMATYTVARLLDLGPDQVGLLFPNQGIRNRITREHAVRTLRNLALTGLVKWEVK